MSGEAQLLRMLEPVVRPGGLPGPRVLPVKPIEQRPFEQLLDEAAELQSDLQKSEEMKFSAHAQKRLEQMGVELTDEQIVALNDATDKAEHKGATDSLMLMKQLGFIVNIPNRTVITALDQQRMQSGVVTQIDSTVIISDPNNGTGVPEQE